MRKGFTLTEEHKRKIGEAHKGMKLSDETKKKVGDSKRGEPSWWRGRKRRPHTEEEKRRVSEKLKGRILHPPFTAESIKKMSDAKKGKHYSIATEFKRGRINSEESRKKMSDAQKRIGNRPPIIRGAANHMWKGGITPINEKIRKSIEYKLWRKAVIERDKYTCVWCGIVQTRENPMHVDHIKPFCDYPELRFAIDNGRTLCIPCHKTTETYAGKITAYRVRNKNNLSTS